LISSFRPFLRQDFFFFHSRLSFHLFFWLSFRTSFLVQDEAHSPPAFVCSCSPPFARWHRIFGLFSVSSPGNLPPPRVTVGFPSPSFFTKPPLFGSKITIRLEGRESFLWRCTPTPAPRFARSAPFSNFGTLPFGLKISPLPSFFFPFLFCNVRRLFPAVTVHLKFPPQ